MLAFVSDALGWLRTAAEALFPALQAGDATFEVGSLCQSLLASRYGVCTSPPHCWLWWGFPPMHPTGCCGRTAETPYVPPAGGRQPKRVERADFSRNKTHGEVFPIKWEISCVELTLTPSCKGRVFEQKRTLNSCLPENDQLLPLPIK